MQIVNLEEIQGILLRLPEIVDHLEKNDPKFTALVKIWLADLEKALARNRLPQAADVAALRSMLISAERGVVHEGLEFAGRKTTRKVKEAVATESLRRAEGLASDAIRGYADQIAEGEKLARQLVALSEQKGIIQKFSGASNHSAMLTGIWSAMSEYPDLVGGTTSLKGLVGFGDALILVDRMLPYFEE